MNLAALVTRRRMRRSFSGAPIAAERVGRLCELALTAPTAGNSAGVVMTVLTDSAIPSFFARATDEAWRSGARRAPGLQRAGAIVSVFSQPAAYVRRYAEADKARSGLDDENRWPVPYWHTDAAMATMQLLLLLEAEGLAATIWGNFRHEDAVRSLCGHDESWRYYASVLIGVDDGHDVRSASLDRDAPSRKDRVTYLS